jgi:hypothetical protein
MPARSKKRMKTPSLTHLKYGAVYCELGHETIVAGDLVAWWRVGCAGGRKRWAAYCADCHWANVRHGGPLR